MSEFLSMADAEAIACQVIRDDVAGSRVYTSIPKKPTFPLVTVKRIGGTPVVVNLLDRASLQVEAWGNNKSEARKLADDARLALHRAQTRTFSTLGGDVQDAFISAVEDTLGLTWQPDPMTNMDRYLFGVALTLHVTDGVTIPPGPGDEPSEPVIDGGHAPPGS